MPKFPVPFTDITAQRTHRLAEIKLCIHASHLQTIGMLFEKDIVNSRKSAHKKTTRMGGSEFTVRDLILLGSFFGALFALSSNILF